MSKGECAPLQAVLDLGRNDTKNDLVQSALDVEGIPYGVCSVGDYDEPRLRVGNGELVGIREIKQHMPEIKSLTL